MKKKPAKSLQNKKTYGIYKYRIEVQCIRT